MKNLNEMTLEELWVLFPIQLVEPNSKNWFSIYEREKFFLESILNAEVKIHHIGSTAIKGIWAKPIVDILIEASISDFISIKESLISSGYLCMAESPSTIDLNKGYTSSGFAEEVFHIHVKQIGNIDELYFRDYLNCYPKVAKEYEQLKITLWKEFQFNRDEYTNKKTDFVSKYTLLAKNKVSEIEKIINEYPVKIQEMFWEIKSLILKSLEEDLQLSLDLKLWAKLPSFYVDERFIRVIPFKNHINIEASKILDYRDMLNDYKLTPKGMLQVSENQNLPKDILLKMFHKTLLPNTKL